MTKNAAHLIAIHEAIKMTPKTADLTLVTQSKSSFKLLTKKLEQHENEGYLVADNSELMKSIHAMTTERSGATYLELEINKNDTNREIKLLAKAALNNPIKESSDTRIKKTWWLTGARLSEITQSLAYKHIRKSKMGTYKEPLITKSNVKKIIQDTKTHLGITIKEEVWKTIRHKDIGRTTCYYLWMAIHDGYMIGKRWERESYAEEYRAQGRCAICETTESMDHILFKCKANGQKSVWKKAKAIWKKKTDIEWLQPTLGTIVTSRLANFKNEDTERDTHLCRFYNIIMVEAAHLIWKLRCERVIKNKGEQHSKSTVRNKLLTTINKRLEVNWEMTNPRYEKRAQSKFMVLQTWKGVLQNESTLPEDWTNARCGVLVGIDPCDDNGRGRDRRLSPPITTPSTTPQSPTLSA